MTVTMPLAGIGSADRSLSVVRLSLDLTGVIGSLRPLLPLAVSSTSPLLTGTLFGLSPFDGEHLCFFALLTSFHLESVSMGRLSRLWVRPYHFPVGVF